MTQLPAQAQRVVRALQARSKRYVDVRCQAAGCRTSTRFMFSADQLVGQFFTWRWQCRTCGAEQSSTVNSAAVQTATVRGAG